MLQRLLARLRQRAEDAAIRRAHLLFDGADYAGAAAAYAAALARQPSAPLCVNLGYSRLMLGDHDAARASFRRALELQPGFAAALVGLGDHAAQHSKHQQAIAYYDQALVGDAGL